VNAFVTELDVASVTVAEKENLPSRVGMPRKNPSVASLSPAGNDPAETVQEYGGVPPLAAKLES
jgi:hypothetical protein